MSVVVDIYKDLMSRHDPRTINWPLISSPLPLAIIVSSYVFFSTKLGPWLMRDRKPFQLRNTLIVYNFIQVLLSIYLVYEGLLSGWLYDYSFTCQPVDYSNNPKALRIAAACYLYFICKLMELMDTVFFVLRKKDRQISFLHVYHHGMMPFCAWIGVRFVAGGHGTLLGLINSFIHILMYAYYMLSAFGPQVQKYLWWKKYLTSLQLIQFSIILVHSAQVLFRDCNYPKPLIVLLTINASLFIYLFGSFYVKTYNKRCPDESTKVDGKTNGSIKNGHAKMNGHSNNLTNGHSNNLTNGHSKSHKTD